MSQTVEVLIRVRPSSISNEANGNNNNNSNISIDEDQGKVYLPRPKNKNHAEFTFTKVYGPGSDQRYVYSGCNVIEHILNGIDCCIMTYGQTNTGKTYTMYGKGWENHTNLQNTDPLNLTVKSGFNGGASLKIGPLLPPPTDPAGSDDQSITSNHDGNNPDSDNDSIIPLYDPIKETMASSSLPSTSSESLGIIPRCISELFENLERKCENNPGFVYSVSCQILQIYNEKIYDLLTDKKRKNPLPLREFGNHQNLYQNNSNVIDGATSSSSSVFVRGISVYQIDSKEEAFHLIKKSMKNKATRATDFNNVSSRSHTVLQLFVSIEEEEGGSKENNKNNGGGGVKIIRRSTLSLIDLAGSEKWRPSLSVNGVAEAEAQVKEMTNINTSLHVLGNCIAKLIENNNSNNNNSGGNSIKHHIPFRDSVLTRLLQNSLNGNGKSIIVATVHSDPEYMEENYSTLQFASRASKVKVTLTANVGITEQISLVEAQRHIKLLQQQLQELKASNLASSNANVMTISNIPMTVTVQECCNCENTNANYQLVDEKLQQLEGENKKLKEKNKKLREQINKLQEENYQLKLQPQPLQQQQLQPSPYSSNVSLKPDAWAALPQVSSSLVSANASIITSGIPRNNVASLSQLPIQQTNPMNGIEAKGPAVELNTYLNVNNSDGGTIAGAAFQVPQQISSNASSYQSSTTFAPMSTTNHSGGINANYSSSVSKKKVIGGKCRKHGLEECVLCSIFGGNKGGEEEEEEENGIQSSPPTQSFQHPPSSSASSNLPVGRVPSLDQLYKKTYTPILSDRKPTTSGSDRPSSYSNRIITPQSTEKSFSSRSMDENDYCKTHSLRNCLLCANELTFQREVQFTHQLDSLAKKTSAVLNMSLPYAFNNSTMGSSMGGFGGNGSITKLAPLYERPGIESTSTTTASTIVTFGGGGVRGGRSVVEAGEGSSEDMINRNGFISTLDSLESSQVGYGFIDPTKSHHKPSNTSSLTTSLNTIRSAAFPGGSRNLGGGGGGGLASSPTSHDVARAAILAANSLLNSKEFDGNNQFSSASSGKQFESNNDNNLRESDHVGGVKSKRLRELKALTTHSMGNTTSPGVLETIYPSNTSNSNQQQIGSNHIGSAVLPRRSSTSPAPNHSIPIEPIHNYHKPPIDYNNYNQQQQQQPSTGINYDNTDDDLLEDDDADDEDDDGMDTDEALNYASSQHDQKQQPHHQQQQQQRFHHKMQSNDRNPSDGTTKNSQRPTSRTKSDTNGTNATVAALQGKSAKKKKVKKKKKKLDPTSVKLVK